MVLIVKYIFLHDYKNYMIKNKLILAIDIVYLLHYKGLLSNNFIGSYYF